MPELSHRRRLGVLAICCVGVVMGSLDSTVLNVALPSIRRQFDAGVSGMQWVIGAYTLVLASLLMLAGAVGDRVGRRTVLQIGLAVFTIGSLLCSLAPNVGWLIAARVVQAVGGSMLAPVAMAIVTNTFTDSRERARAIGVWSGAFNISMAVGPLLGGALVDSIGWRSIFWVNLPLGLAALFLTAKYVPESRTARPRRPDPVGQLLIIVLMASLTFAIIEAPDRGWSSPVIWTATAIAFGALIGLLHHEPRSTDPLIDLRLFTSAPFRGAMVIAVCGFAAFGGFLFLSTFYLQDIRHLDPLHAGLWMLPMAVTAAACALLSGRLVASRGPRTPLLLAGAAMTTSGLLFAVFAAETADGTLLLSYAVFGLGYGFMNAPITNTAVSEIPRSQAGIASALASTSRQFGQTLGVAVIGAVLASGTGTTHTDGFVAASRPAWWIITGCGLIILLLGALTTSRRAEQTARQSR